MSKIKSAIAISDTHLGRDISYLYAKDLRYKKNKDVLLTLLKDLGPRDELILNGDIMELALGGLDEVYHDVKEFFKLISEAGPYQRLVYIPGNHDHHFWRTLGEQIYINDKIKRRNSPPSRYKYPHCFVDERFSTTELRIKSNIIFTYLWPRGEPVPEIVIKYPHHLVEIPSKKGGKQHYLFTHGHFLEDLFRPINFLVDPAHLEELEAFNNIWLEAFNYHLGHAGRLSDKVIKLEESYVRGGREARTMSKEVLHAIYKNLCKKFNLRWPKTWILIFVIRYIVKSIPIEKKSGLFGVSIDEKLKQNIVEYVEKYILKRYVAGGAEEFHFPSNAEIPTPFTFVFGHTHQPVRQEDIANEKVIILDKTYQLANTGGWLRTDGPKANGENAGIFAIDASGARWVTLEGKLA